MCTGRNSGERPRMKTSKFVIKLDINVKPQCDFTCFPREITFVTACMLSGYRASSEKGSIVKGENLLPW